MEEDKERGARRTWREAAAAPPVLLPPGTLDPRGEILLSVIIPSRNHAAYLPHTVRSVLECGPRDLEVMVVDDGSTDGTEAALASFGPALRYIYQEYDGFLGPGSAVNRGLLESRGRFLHCLDSDDQVLPETYPRLLGALERDPRAGMVCSDAWTMDAQGRPTGRWGGREPGPLLRSLVRGNWIISSTVVVRREVYAALGGRRPEYEMADDYELWLRIAEGYPVRHVPRPLVRRRLHPAGIGRRAKILAVHEERILREFLARHEVADIFPGLGPGLRKAARAHARVGGLLLHRGHPGLAQEAFERARELWLGCPDPDLWQAREALRRDPEAARRHLREAARLAPLDPRVWVLAARALTSRGAGRR